MTPGYLPGPVTAGEWRVLLGPHRVPADGLAWEVEVQVGSAAVQPPPPPPPLPRETAGAGAARRAWALLARRRPARAHRPLRRDHPHLAAAAAWSGVVLVPGQEVTTDTGHANCFGDTRWVDFRRSADEWLADAAAHDGLLSINHPVAGELAWRMPLSGAPHLVEAWHATWDRRSSAPLAWWDGAGGVGVGGSDLHDPAVWTLGAPTTWVQVEDGDGVRGILDALAAGRVAVAADPHGQVAVRHDGELVVERGSGLQLVAPDGERMRVVGDRCTAPGALGRHLLVDDAGTVVALTA